MTTADVAAARVPSTSLSVLVVAYECSPVRGHAPGSAWKLVTRLAQWHRVVVVTEESQYRKEIEAQLADHGAAASLSFHFVPSPGRGYSGTRPVLPFRSLWNYRKWLAAAAEKAVELHRTHRFDIAHHLRGNSFREPGFLYRLGVPFVWGPVGGTTVVPLHLLRNASLREKAEHVVRNFINWSQLRFSPVVRKAFGGASCVMAQTSRDKRNFDAVYDSSCVVIHEQNADVEAAVPSRAQPTPVRQGPLRVLWVGQCIARKGFPILVDALSALGVERSIFVEVAGDGPSRPDWQAYARKRGLEGVFRWHGWKSRADVLELMSECDVLVFTSLLEGTPATVMEAISAGLPVICLRHCGHGDVVDDSCGIAVLPETYESVVGGFAGAMTRLMNDAQLRQQLRNGALAKARCFSWDRAAHDIDAVYRRVASRKTAGAA